VDGWKGYRHGDPEAGDYRLELVATHGKVDVGPAREHLHQLLAGGA
jgi:hypothetical protein